MKYFSGFEVLWTTKGITLSQRHYILQLLEDIDMLATKHVILPMDHKAAPNSFDGELLEDQSQFRRLIGILLHFSLSRPNITSVVHKLSSLSLHIYEMSSIYYDY